MSSLFKKLSKLAPHKVLAGATQRAIKFGTSGKGLIGKANPLNPIQATGGVLRTVYSGKGPFSRNLKANLALTREAHQEQENPSNRKRRVYDQAHAWVRSGDPVLRAKGLALLKSLDKKAHRQAISKGEAAVAVGVVAYSAGSLASGASGGSGAGAGASTGATTGGGVTSSGWSGIASTIGKTAGKVGIKVLASGITRANRPPTAGPGGVYAQAETLPINYNTQVPQSMYGAAAAQSRTGIVDKFVDFLFGVFVAPKRHVDSENRPSTGPVVIPAPATNVPPLEWDGGQ